MSPTHGRPAVARKKSSFDRLRTQWPLLAVIGAWLVANAIILFWPEDDADREHYETYVAIWRALEVFRASRTGQAEWTEFSADKLAELQPIIEELDDDASPQEPTKQHLLWAGRDCLMPILQGKSGIDEAKFFDHMSRARSHLRKQGFEVEDITPPQEEGATAGETAEV